MKKNLDKNLRGFGIVLIGLGLVYIALTFGLIQNLVLIPIMIGVGCLVGGYHLTIVNNKEKYKEIDEIMKEFDKEDISKFMEDIGSLIT